MNGLRLSPIAVGEERCAPPLADPDSDSMSASVALTPWGPVVVQEQARQALK